jgi:glucose-6-phosphate isomerase
MTGWQWQDDALWQSCDGAACAQAAAWEKQGDALYGQLQAHVARQPLVAIAQDDAALHQLLQHKNAFMHYCERLVVIGTGGASLGAQAFCALAVGRSQVHFLENCDPVTLDMFFHLPKHSTGWLIISKSGETVETLAATLALVGHYAGDDSLPQRLRVVTANRDSTLGKLATDKGWTILDHPPELGGRFSVFSIVGLLPIAFAGLDITAIAQAAQQNLQRLLQTQDRQLLQHAAWLAANAPSKPMHLLMAYADRLRPATQWFKQLWAESLGKDGRGSTPLTAIGAVDQHSQLQLYLDGPRDKLVTLWLPDVAGIGATLPDTGLDGIAYLAGHRMGDVMRATSEATATTLAKAGVPLRVARGALTPESLAAWFARQMLETLLVAILLDVDPYSQPAVEEGKRLTRAALAGRTA